MAFIQVSKLVALFLGPWHLSRILASFWHGVRVDGVLSNNPQGLLPLAARKFEIGFFLNGLVANENAYQLLWCVLAGQYYLPCLPLLCCPVGLGWAVAGGPFQDVAVVNKLFLLHGGIGLPILLLLLMKSHFYDCCNCENCFIVQGGGVVVQKIKMTACSASCLFLIAVSSIAVDW